MNENPKTFFSINEFAKLLCVHPNTIRTAIKNGRIHAFRVGSGNKSMYRIPANEIDRIALFDLKEMVDVIIKDRENERSALS